MPSGGRSSRGPGRALAASHTALQPVAAATSTALALPVAAREAAAAIGARLVLHARVIGVAHDRLRALHQWRSAVARQMKLEEALAQSGRKLVLQEKSLGRLKADAEAQRKKAMEERQEQSSAATAARRALEEERAASATETARCRRLSLRAAASLLSLCLGVQYRCGAAFPMW